MVKSGWRAALIATLSYAVVVATLLVVSWRNSDAEGRVFQMLFIGFPWVLALFPLHVNSIVFYFVALILNVVTVFIFALAVSKLFSWRD